MYLKVYIAYNIIILSLCLYVIKDWKLVIIMYFYFGIVLGLLCIGLVAVAEKAKKYLINKIQQWNS